MIAVLNLKIGDSVHYGSHGVCQVCGREEKQFGTQSRQYFTLRPQGSGNILLYLPEDADPEKVRIRPILTREQILEELERVRSGPAGWISDSKLRREAFTKVLRSGETGALMGMMRDITAHQRELPTGKQLPMSDQEMLTAARRQLFSEMSYVLGIQEKQILPIILGEENI